MGETVKLVEGVSLEQAQEAIAVASLTGGAVKRLPSQKHKPHVQDVSARPLAREISQLCTQAFEISPASTASMSTASRDPSLASLAKSEPVSSVGPLSTLSHVSVPVTGSIPYGALQVHHPSNTPPTADGTKTKAESIPEASPAPAPPRWAASGDVFVLLDLPGQSVVGLDNTALTVDKGNRFQGFRDIPAGTHLLWVSAPGAMTRCGYWFVTKAKEVRVKQWDRYNETLGEPASQFELREQKDNIDATYPQLLAYQTDEAKGGSPLWQDVTSCISTGLLDRVTGKKGADDWLLDTTDTAKGELHFQQQANKSLSTVVGETELSFLFSPDVVDVQLLNLTRGADYTTDTTAQVLSTLEDDGASDVSEQDLVGELQFTFLTGLHLGNGSCLEQWWHLVIKVILRAHQLAISRPVLCRKLLATLLAQMVYTDRFIAQRAESRNGNSKPTAQDHTSTASPEAATASILEVMPQYKAKLREALTIYKRRLNEALLGLDNDKITPQQAAVGQAFADLEAWFWRYGWDLRSDYVRGETLSDGPVDSDEDELPVVVELDGDGREIGLVSF
jgi:A1 cistron-splicing factor AAR2